MGLKYFISLFAILCTGVAIADETPLKLTFTMKNGQMVIDDGIPSSPTWTATASYLDSDKTVSNFGHLNIETSGQGSDYLQAYTTGFAEGYMTAERINQHYRNMLCQVDCDGVIPTEVREFFNEQELWVRSQIQANPDDTYWKFVNLLLAQYDGLRNGYADSEYVQQDESVNKLDTFAFQMINAIGDLFDIMPAVQENQRPQFKNMNYKEMLAYMTRTGHCSALIKMTDDMKDIYVGHSSWFVYSAMLRIYKTYKFNLSPSAGVYANTTSFSSYPGTLSSLDDFYINQESKLVMTQTTNNIFNESLWDLITPNSLFAWQRVRTANQLANSGPEWSALVGQYNSGTYNNQYMILDGKLFTPGQAMQENTLYVVEQIPGLVVGGDVSDELVKGYWSSYNVPYHKEIYVKSGYPDVDEKGGVATFTQYQQAPRAKIFRQDQSTVKDLKTMQRVMRANEYDKDPLVKEDNDPWSAICARGDLSEVPYGGGGYDSKVTSIQMLNNNGQASIINGPTSQDQPTFVWSTSGLDEKNNVHLGQPDVFDFEFEFVDLGENHV